MKVRFLRHAESEFNCNSSSRTPDCPLTELGRQQASNLRGHYSLVILSPLLRARQTLALASITYDRLEISPLVREHRVDPCDFLLDEEVVVESDEELIRRGDLFLEKLHSLSQGLSSVLVVSHCEFICSLTGASPANAEVVDIVLPPAPIMTLSLLAQLVASSKISVPAFRLPHVSSQHHLETQR